MTMSMPHGESNTVNQCGYVVYNCDRNLSLGGIYRCYVRTRLVSYSCDNGTLSVVWDNYGGDYRKACDGDEWDYMPTEPNDCPWCHPSSAYLGAVTHDIDYAIDHHNDVPK